MIWLIADTHFSDDNIIKFENRPFENSKEMNDFLIKTWNGLVSDNDTVIVVGDFMTFIGEPAYYEEKLCGITEKLKGKKWLIKGNHDILSTETYIKCGFKEVSTNAMILDEFYILTHTPMYINSNMPYANIFGHVHNNPLYKTYSKQHYCVSAERINYSPIQFNYIKDIIKRKNEEG